MGRALKYTDSFIDSTYDRIVRMLRLYNRSMFADELAEKMDITKSTVQRVVHYKRLSWNFEEFPIADYVISTPDGYALVSFGKELFAFLFQYMGMVKSICQWLIPVNEYLKSKYPFEYDQALRERAEAHNDNPNEYDPWAVFKRLV